MKNQIIFIFLLLIFQSCLSQKKEKDTLFIKYDHKLLSQKLGHDKTEYYFIKDIDNKEDVVFFRKAKLYKNINTKNIQCFKKVLKNSNAYYKKNKLDDWKLANYLGRFIIFIVKDKECILVETIYEID